MSEKAARKRFSLTLTQPYLDVLDSLVNEGIFMEHQEVIRAALRVFFRIHGRDPFNPIIQEDPKSLIAESIEMMEELLRRIRNEREPISHSRDS